jgi:hypothetical protein
MQKIGKSDIMDFKLQEKLLYPEKQITYLGLDDPSSRNYNICLFNLAKHTKMPLHDHPLMFVFSKIVHGSCKREAFGLND